MRAKRVWILDDDPLQVMELEEELKALGYDVSTFTELDQFKTAVDVHGLPDVIVCDGMLTHGLTVMDVRKYCESVEGFKPETFLLRTGSCSVADIYLTAYPEGNAYQKMNDDRKLLALFSTHAGMEMN